MLVPVGKGQTSGEWRTAVRVEAAHLNRPVGARFLTAPPREGGRLILMKSLLKPARENLFGALTKTPPHLRCKLSLHPRLEWWQTSPGLDRASVRRHTHEAHSQTAALQRLTVRVVLIK